MHLKKTVISLLSWYKYLNSISSLNRNKKVEKINNDTASLFNQYSRFYTGIGSYIPSFIEKQDQEIMEIVINALPERGRVIDVACGTGTLLHRIAKELNAECFGIDFSEGMIDQARQRTNSSIMYEVGDAHQPPKYLYNTGDVVICKNSFYFLNPNLAVKALANLTKEKGILILTTLTEDPNLARLYSTAFAQGIFGPPIEWLKNNVKTSDVFRAWDSIIPEIKYQRKVASAANIKDAIRRDELELLLSEHFENINFQKGHYCDTQYLIVAQKR